jgi:hypothetical protein
MAIELIHQKRASAEVGRKNVMRAHREARDDARASLRDPIPVQRFVVGARGVPRVEPRDFVSARDLTMQIELPGPGRDLADRDGRHEVLFEVSLRLCVEKAIPIARHVVQGRKLRCA